MLVCNKANSYTLAGTRLTAHVSDRGSRSDWSKKCPEFLITQKGGESNLVRSVVESTLTNSKHRFNVILTNLYHRFCVLF